MRQSNNGHSWGKWRKAGVPHKGWRCVGSYDSCEDGGDPHLHCEMCERQSIRYVHVMEHDDYPKQLRCGFKCAADLGEDYAAAKHRDKSMRKRAEASRGVPQAESTELSPSWVKSDDGKLRIALPEGRATVFRNGATFDIWMRPRGEGVRFGNTNYITAKEAQLAAQTFLQEVKLERDSDGSLLPRAL